MGINMEYTNERLDRLAGAIRDEAASRREDHRELRSELWNQGRELREQIYGEMRELRQYLIRLEAHR